MLKAELRETGHRPRLRELDPELYTAIYTAGDLILRKFEGEPVENLAPRIDEILRATGGKRVKIPDGSWLEEHRSLLDMICRAKKLVISKYCKNIIEKSMVDDPFMQLAEELSEHRTES